MHATWCHVFYPHQPSTPLQQHYVHQLHATRPDKVVHYFKGSHTIVESTKHSRFLMQLAEWAPRAVLKQISLLLLQLDSEVRSHSIPLFIRLMQKCTNSVLSNADGHHGDHQPAHPQACMLQGPCKQLAPHPDTLELVHLWLSHHGLSSSSISMTHSRSWFKLTGVPVSQANQLLGALYQVYRGVGAINSMILLMVGYGLPAVLHVHVKTVVPMTVFTSIHTPSVGEAAASANLKVD